MATRNMTDFFSKPTMTSQTLKDGSAWYVRLTWPDGHAEHVGDFHSESECDDWISYKSEAWLKAKTK